MVRTPADRAEERRAGTGIAFEFRPGFFMDSSALVWGIARAPYTRLMTGVMIQLRRFERNRGYGMKQLSIALVTLALSSMAFTPLLARDGDGREAGAKASVKSGTNAPAPAIITGRTAGHRQLARVPAGQIEPQSAHVAFSHNEPGVVSLCPPPRRMTERDGCQ